MGCSSLREKEVACFGFASRERNAPRGSKNAKRKTRVEETASRVLGFVEFLAVLFLCAFRAIAFQFLQLKTSLRA